MIVVIRYSQQLELWIEFNIHATSILHTCSPFFCYYSIPFLGFPFPFFGFKGVLCTYYLTGCVTTFTSYNCQYVRWLIFIKIYIKIMKSFHIRFMGWKFAMRMILFPSVLAFSKGKSTSWFEPIMDFNMNREPLPIIFFNKSLNSKGTRTLFHQLVFFWM